MVNIIIDNLNNDDNKGVKLYEYKFIFNDANKEQQSFIEDRFIDWSWNLGLNIVHLKKVCENSLVKYIFLSPIPFQDKDMIDWSEEDLKRNIVTKLVGKEQFISEFLYSDCNVDTLNIFFYDHNENKYSVEVSKYSEILRT